MKALYTVSGELLQSLPIIAAIFDDVLTSGAHYRAMADLLNEAAPGMRIIGVFLARTV